MKLNSRCCPHCGGLLVVTHTVRALQYKVQYFRCKDCHRRPPKGTKRILSGSDPITRCRAGKSSKAQAVVVQAQR